MRRIVVVGTSGSGKSTLAAQLAARLGIAHIELDELFHGPGWTDRDDETFRALLRERMDAAPRGWVTCGNYVTRLDGMHWREADILVWIDLPLRVVMSRVIRRTFRRLITREELWNGNHESWSGLWSRGGVIRWAWDTHHLRRQQFTAAMASSEWSGSTWVHLRSAREVRAWLGGLSAADVRDDRRDEFSDAR